MAAMLLLLANYSSWSFRGRFTLRCQSTHCPFASTVLQLAKTVIRVTRLTSSSTVWTATQVGYQSTILQVLINLPRINTNQKERVVSPDQQASAQAVYSALLSQHQTPTEPEYHNNHPNPPPSAPHPPCPHYHERVHDPNAHHLAPHPNPALMARRKGGWNRRESVA